MKFDVEGFTKTFDAFPFYIILVDSRHNIVYANKHVYNMLQISLDDIIGKYCPKTVHNINEPFAGCPLEEAVNTGKPVEKELYDEANDRWVLSSVYPVGMKTQAGTEIYLHIIQDITLKKNAEISNQRAYDLQKTVNLVISLVLKNLTIEQILSESLRMVLMIPWFSLESRGAIFLVDKKKNVLKMAVENGLSPFIKESCSEVEFGRCICGRAALSGLIQYKDCMDEEHETRYNGIYDHGHYCLPILSSSNKVMGVLNLYLKKGHKKNDMEIEFLRAVCNTIASALEYKLIEHELKDKEEALYSLQKIELIGQSTGNIAHDFNNILACIKGYAELLFKELEKETGYKMFIDEINGAIIRAITLNRQLLAFSRKQELNIKENDINLIIENTTRMLKVILGSNIKLEISPASDLFKIYADTGQIEQVVSNLVINAKQAMPNGGEIIIKTENVLKNDTYSDDCLETKPGEYACLTVTDTGCGMTEEVKRRIFEPFFTTKPKGEGTGLGMSVVYGIVKQHRGWIEVESEVGRGTRFKIYLPKSSNNDK